MVKLFQSAGKCSSSVRKTIKDVVLSCNICMRFQKTPPRPKVALPKASTTNEVVSVDLKERRDLKKYILYMCDEFSGYMAAVVINNKLPETIIRAFHRKWIREGPGIPDRGVFADNGGEFKNPELKEVAAKYGITITLTAANSPWSNGKNERNHYTCDLTTEKLMEEDSKLSIEDAVSHAVNAKNLQINKTGFSPRQLIFGKQGIIPGITDGNPANFEEVVESDVFRRELINRQRSEELYRKIDANARIQKALAQQAHGYLDHKYSAGDMIIFKEDGKNRWTGPAKVTGTENSKVRIIHAGYDRTVPACRVLPFKEEKHEDESEEQTDGDANDKKHEDVDESEKQTDNNETDKRTSTNINSEVDANDPDFIKKLCSKLIMKLCGRKEKL